MRRYSGEQSNNRDDKKTFVETATVAAEELTIEHDFFSAQNNLPSFASRS